MFSIEEKKKMIEQGIQQFHINPKFRDCLKWFVDEMDKVYDKQLEKYIGKKIQMPNQNGE